MKSFTTCNKLKDGTIRSRSPWLIMKKSPTFHDWMLIADFVSTQFRQAKYVAWSLRRMWTSSRNENSSGSWDPWMTMSFKTSGKQRLFRWTNILKKEIHFWYCILLQLTFTVSLKSFPVTDECEPSSKIILCVFCLDPRAWHRIICRNLTFNTTNI